MGFNLVILPPHGWSVHNAPKPELYFPKEWVHRIKNAVPDINIELCSSPGQAFNTISDADAAFGEVFPEIFQKATRLKWICCPWAGPPRGYYHKALVESNVIVTNMREIYSDHMATHIISLVLTFAKNINP